MLIRAAVDDDAPAACALIRESITVLCEPDHHGDARHIERWLSNKTADNVRRWIHQTHVLVAEEEGEIVGVAAMNDDGKVTLNYVSPGARFRGVSKALMHRLEDNAKRRGLSRLTLETTRTALPFYEALGFTKAPTTYVLPLTGTMATVLVKRMNRRQRSSSG